MTKKVIGFVSTSNPINDRMALSGTPYKMREAIENAGYNVKWIKACPNPLISFLFKVTFKIIPQTRFLSFSKVYGWLIVYNINREDLEECDFLLIYFGSQYVGYLANRSNKLPPIIYYSDACFCQMINYYWIDIPKWIISQANALEKSAIDCSALVIKSSDWAINSAIIDYGCTKEKITVLEFGANIDEKDIIIAEPYKGGELRILFSGICWKRKGCDIAIDTVKRLNEKGIIAKLYLVGLDEYQIPIEYRNLYFVEYVGFLHKNIPQQYDNYIDIVSHCHFLLLPTRAECSAIVFCEASAFGLPSFTYDTGGLSNYVVNGETGYRLSIESTCEDFANVIETSVKNNELNKLRKGALALYKEKTSWSAWSRRFATLMDERFLNDRNDECNQNRH